MRLIVSGLLALALSLSTAPARADTHQIIHQAFAAGEAWTQAWVDRLSDRAQDLAAQAHDAIIVGGIIISMNRNTISGGVVGCTLGAATGAGSTLALAVPTMGASVAAAPNAGMIGCALGAAGGAALGYSLDYPDGR